MSARVADRVGLFAEWLRPEGVWALKNEAMAGDRVLFTVRLMPIHFDERELRAGRFALFRLVAQAHAVVVENPRVHDGMQVPWFEGWINWIAEHAREPWSVRVEHPHLGHAVAHFSFQSPRDAVLFKLVFA